MKAVIQRVENAVLSVDGKVVSQIGLGLAVYLGVEETDTAADIAPFCKKLAALRIFEDENGKLNLSVRDVAGSVMLVSNFTLCGNISHGNRPDFMAAMKPAPAKLIYEQCVSELNKLVPTVAGVFGADMKIVQSNIGPVTILY